MADLIIGLIALAFLVVIVVYVYKEIQIEKKRQEHFEELFISFMRDVSCGVGSIAISLAEIEDRNLE